MFLDYHYVIYYHSKLSFLVHMLRLLLFPHKNAIEHRTHGYIPDCDLKIHIIFNRMYKNLPSVTS